MLLALACTFTKYEILCKYFFKHFVAVINTLSWYFKNQEEVFSRNISQWLLPSWIYLDDFVTKFFVFVYQARIWVNLTTTQNLRKPENFGWRRDGSLFKPVWTTLPENVVSCEELTKCGSKTVCLNRCKCLKERLVCTELCNWGTNCDNGSNDWISNVYI